jgi:hypothetical protein
MRTICGVCTALGLLAAPAIAADSGDSRFSGYLSSPEETGKYTVNLNAGVGGYLGELSDFTGVGPVWGVDVNGDATRGIGWEVGYNGARTPLTDGRIGDGEAAWRHGVNGMAKLFAPGMETIRPFAGVGLGAAYINPSEDAEGPFQNDWVTEIPVAAGVELTPGNAGFSAGLRATYRFQAGEEFAKDAAQRVSPGADSPEGGLLSAALTFGGKF